MSVPDPYRIRFENLFRGAKRIASSLEIGDTLEIIRDEAKASIPGAKEACLLMFDPEASNYVGRETARRIGGDFPLYDRGPMHFKNVHETVRVYSLIRAS